MARLRFKISMALDGFVVIIGPLLWSAASPAQAVERDLAYGPDPAQRLDLSVLAGKGYQQLGRAEGR